MKPLPVPEYSGVSSRGIALAVEDMKRHTTDEGWQIMAGLEKAGYSLHGYNLGNSETDVRKILKETYPGIVVVQDKREWDVSRRDFREVLARFNHSGVLALCPDIFKVTILKDAHQRPAYHEQAAKEIDCHAWIVYYNPDTVAALSPFVRREHLIRTYHTLDPQVIPEFSFSAATRFGTVISGAVSTAYPLRSRLVWNDHFGKNVTILHHPGYHRRGCNTPSFLNTLIRYKVSICTASTYDYALRKLMESAACGCRVVTDLSESEKLPVLDKYLIRVPSDISPEDMVKVCNQAEADYDPALQEQIAKEVIEFYDYKAMGIRLAQDIETLRENY